MKNKLILLLLLLEGMVAGCIPLAKAQVFPTAATTAVTVDANGNLITNFASTNSNVIDLRLGTVLLNAQSTINGLAATSYSSAGGWSMAGGAGAKLLVVSSSYTLAGTGGTLSLSGALTTSGAFPLTLSVSAATGVWLPVTGTLSTLTGTETLTNKTVNGLTITTSTGALNITGGGAITTTGTFALSGSGTLNLGAGGTLGTLAYASAAPANTLTTNTLNATVTASSLQTLGTITLGVWNGTALTDAYIPTALAGHTYNGLNIPAASGTLSILTGTLSVTGTNLVTTSGAFTLSGSGLLNFGAGGVLGSAAYTATTVYAAVAGGNAMAGANTYSGATTFSSGATTSFSSGSTTSFGGTVSYAAGITAPAVAKAWGILKGADGSLLAGYNVGTTSRSAAGIYMVTFSNAMGNASYSAAMNTEFTALAIARMTNATANAASFSITVCASNSTAIDPTSVMFTIFGN